MSILVSFCRQWQIMNYGIIFFIDIHNNEQLNKNILVSIKKYHGESEKERKRGFIGICPCSKPYHTSWV